MFTFLFDKLNLLRTIHTKFYRSQWGFVEDMTKTSGVFISVHSV